MWLLALVHK